MVTIYALINPLNNRPFYVGSSVNPKARLSAHNTSNEGTNEKREILRTIKEAGKRAELLPLLVCTEMAASKCETYIYNLLINNGYKLCNLPSNIMSRQRYHAPDHWFKTR